MRKSVLGALVICLAAAGGIWAMGGWDPAAFPSAVEKLNKAYSDAMNAGDVTAYMAAWDADGVQMPPDAPMVVGKANITTGMQALFSAVDVSNFVINMQEAVQLGPGFAYSRGTYSYTAVAKSGGSATTYDGKFSTLWKKQADGSWKISRDCFNSNVPKS